MLRAAWCCVIWQKAHDAEQIKTTFTHIRVTGGKKEEEEKRAKREEKMSATAFIHTKFIWLCAGDGLNMRHIRGPCTHTHTPNFPFTLWFMNHERWNPSPSQDIFECVCGVRRCRDHRLAFWASTRWAMRCQRKQIEVEKRKEKESTSATEDDKWQSILFTNSIRWSHCFLFSSSRDPSLPLAPPLNSCLQRARRRGGGKISVDQPR